MHLLLQPGVARNQLVMTLNSQFNVVRVGRKKKKKEVKYINIFVFLHSQRFPVLPPQLPASSEEAQPINSFPEM